MDKSNIDPLANVGPLTIGAVVESLSAERTTKVSKEDIPDPQTTKVPRAAIQEIMNSALSPGDKLQKLRELGVDFEKTKKPKKPVEKKELTESDRAQIREIMNSSISPASKLAKLRELGLD